MIRVPTIAINRPWMVSRGRKRTPASANVLERAEQELAYQRRNARAEREKAEVFRSAVLDGRLMP